MASNTPNLGLLKKDPATDGNETFNIKTMLNDNWDKIDEAVGNIQVPEASTTQKGIVQLSNATDGTREDVAATEKAVKAAVSNTKTYVDNKPWQKAKLTNDDGTVILLQGVDANLLITTGRYVVDNPKNGPSVPTGAGPIWYVNVDASVNNLYVTQEWTNYYVQSYIQRKKVEGTWGAWSPDLFMSVGNGKIAIKDAVDRQNGGALSPASGKDWEFSALANVIKSNLAKKTTAIKLTNTNYRRSVPPNTTDSGQISLFDASLSKGEAIPRLLQLTYTGAESYYPYISTQAEWSYGSGVFTGNHWLRVSVDGGSNYYNLFSTNIGQAITQDGQSIVSITLDLINKVAILLSYPKHSYSTGSYLLYSKIPLASFPSIDSITKVTLAVVTSYVGRDYISSGSGEIVFTTYVNLQGITLLASY